jgi:hypothetical protein
MASGIREILTSLRIGVYIGVFSIYRVVSG